MPAQVLPLSPNQRKHTEVFYDTQGIRDMALAKQSEGFLTLLKKRNFLRLWLAQLISMTILQASNYALLILIEEKTKSTTLIGLAIISFSIPAVLFGAPAGVVVDRMNKRRVLWSSNCLRALATILFVVVLLTNCSDLLPVYLLTFIISSIGQFFTPAEGSTIPMLVSEDELTSALSLFNLTFMLSQALGFVLFAPILLSILPTFTIHGVTIDAIVQLYAIIGLLYLVCAWLILLISPESFAQKTNTLASNEQLAAQTISIIGNVWHEMQQGWSFVRQRKPLFQAVIQLSFAGVLILVISQLATPIVTQLLLLPPNTMAVVFAPAGIGLVVGSVFLPRVICRLGGSRTILDGIIGLTVVTLALPLITVLARTLFPLSWHSNPIFLFIFAVLMFAAGIALNFINVPAQTAMQALTPNWIKGRVLALQLVLYNACSIPIILFIGAFSDLFGIEHVLYILAFLEAIFGIWGIHYEHKHPQTLPESMRTADPAETAKVAQGTSKSVDG